MRRILSQTSFTTGEISPRLYGHTDLAKYKNALKTLTNARTLPHGPVLRRNGSKFIEETKTSSTASRLLRFQFNQTTAYIIELGNQYMRFYKSGARVESGGSPVEVATPWGTADLFEVTYVQYGNTIYFAHEDYAPRQLVWTSDTEWALTQIDFYPEPTKEQGYEPAATLTPSATTGTGITLTAGSSVFLKGDIGRQVINNADGETGRASITGYTSGTQVTADVLEDFTDTNAIASGDWKLDLSPIGDITPTGTRVGSIITLDVDEFGGTTALDAFRSADVGDYVLIHNGIVEITDTSTASAPTGEVQKSLNAKSETEFWTLEQSAWNATNKYPRVVTMHQQRLVFCSTDADPQTVWMSEAGVFDSIAIGADDSDGISFDIATPEVNQAQWATSVGGVLAMGTTAAELTISAGSINGPLTPDNVTQETRSYEGSNLQQAVTIGNEVVYVQRSGRKINSFRYDFNTDNYSNDELTFLAEHMTAGTTIKELAVARDPDRTIYAVLNDGDMLVGTYLREQNVIGWARYSTDGSYESVNTISTGTTDEVWVIVNRTINGATKRYVERFDYADGTDRLHGFSDSFLTYSDPYTISGITKASPGVVTTSSAHGYSNGDSVKLVGVGGMTEVEGKTYVVANKTSTTFELTDSGGNNIDTSGFTTFTSGGEAHKLVTTISGLDHLEGETVQIKADGATHPDATVSSGSITLDRSSYEVVVGMPYTTTITLLPADFDNGQGRMVQQQVRWVRPILNLYKSGLPAVNGEIIPARDALDRMDSALGLYTGNAEYDGYTWEEGSSLSITMSNPLPLMLLSVSGTTDSGVR